MSGLNNKILGRVRSKSRGKWVFSAKDFLDLGQRDAVDQALSRLARRGVFRRVGNGLYDFPRMSKILNGPAPVDMDAAVAAITRRDGIRIMPDGLASAHGLGLTNAVPAKSTYFTDGSTRDVKIGNRIISFRHAGPKVMSWADRPAAPVIQSLLWLGPLAGADAEVISSLKQKLSDTVKRDMADGITNLPNWAANIARDLIEPDIQA